MNNKTLPLEHGMILDMDRCYASSPVRIYRKDDSSAHVLKINLCCGGAPFFLPQSCLVTIYVKRQDGTTLWSSCETDGKGGVSHTFTASELSVSGKAECELYIVGENVAMTSPKFVLYIENTLRNDEAIEASDDFSVLRELVAKTRQTAQDLLKTSVQMSDAVPTAATEGEAGDILACRANGAIYRCAGTENGHYKWESVGKAVYLTVHKPLIPGQGGTFVLDELKALMAESSPVALFIKYHPSAGTMNYTYVPAAYSKNSSMLTVTAIANAASSWEKVVITYNGFTETGNVAVKKMLATPDLVADEEYKNSAPTVEAVSRMLESKQGCVITDSAGYFAEKTVEGALSQLGAAFANSQSSLDAVLAMIGGRT